MTETALAAPRPRVFHGWVVVWGAFVVMFVGFGVSYSFSAFFDPLKDEFNANRSDVSLVFAITNFPLGAEFWTSDRRFALAADGQGETAIRYIP